MQTLKSPADIQPSGNWGADNQAGRELAGAYVAAARAQNDPCLINAAIRSLASAGRWTAVEVGFAFGLAGAVIS